ncbi:fatty acid desaturase family protein [Nocardia asteroides]|uniref:Acyl-CoA desaturase n=1 Tax=Nocardia asteroides NBRC 15531 TaxID=1110697 RepID=U5EKZ7_NOCAS|nr:acyl-CoA desaturase [Nocardia asteroides]TLF63324.1 acyl-CoA desaturase [Nocardia asteroides NBRC 15531]UGT47257.1 acyl-CoA desaturase [Nocardia asteroides]SFM74661.1 Fatty acid desaturase [Nocardia asteroides]VEG33854.1 Stearoyl-CoA 9-desaturase [Nocardia asteroides]GAD87013.1 putative acyl-CoA desaturase [Nocardia asteroides NBRC 15531]
MTILTEGKDGPVILTPDQVEEIGRTLDELRARVEADLGERDRDYIYKIIKTQRGFEIAGRGLMYLGFLPPFWLAGVAALGVSKILDNMEIGHNVMHGQYDWMRERGINSREFDWDTVCPADQWKHSHNYMHHTYTNVHDMDRDIGYGILRIDEGQKWNPYYLGNPIYAFLLMVLFEWGVMVHDLEADNIIKGKRTWAELKPLLKGQGKKAGKQVLKDYVVFPALTGPLFLHTLAGNAAANLVRNLWTFSIIFCGHFPAGVQTFTKEETEVETRGEWYVRQMLGSANIKGSKLFHIMSGNLSHQIEHHLFPDIPANRYPEMAPEVKALAEKFGLPYNTGRFSKQIGSVWAKIFLLSVPDRFVKRAPQPGVIVVRNRKATEVGV